MENFKEIAEKCLAGELSGTFVTAFDNHWHSSYLQRYAILGHEMPEQYVLGPGIIYNDRGQCTSNEKVKIVNFIPDTMKNFKEIAEKCLAGELSGTFVLRNGDKCISSTFKKDQGLVTSFSYADHFYYSDNGRCYTIAGHKSEFDVIDFIPDNMPEQIKIDVPEGKVPVMEQTEKGVVITWKEKELTYTELLDEFRNNLNCIHVNLINSSSQAFYKKVEVLRKLTNIRNYFGKPTGGVGYTITQSGIVTIATNYKNLPVFTKKEHAEQAIKILGDDVKYLFEPW